MRNAALFPYCSMIAQSCETSQTSITLKPQYVSVLECVCTVGRRPRDTIAQMEGVKRHPSRLSEPCYVTSRKGSALPARTYQRHSHDLVSWEKSRSESTIAGLGSGYRCAVCLRPKLTRPRDATTVWSTKPSTFPLREGDHGHGHRQESEPSPTPHSAPFRELPGI